MRTTFLLATVMLAACGDTDINPDPTSSSQGGSTANAGGSPSDGGGGTSDGGTHQGGAGGDGGGQTIGGGYESGSRLKVRTLVGADGSRSPVGWFDTQTNAECAWKRASDGEMRCLPVADIATYYTDGCATPIVRVQSCAVPTVMLELADTCGTRFKVRSVGATVNPSEVWIRSGETCTSLPAPPPGTYYALNTETPASTFVAATVESEP